LSLADTHPSVPSCNYFAHLKVELDYYRAEDVIDIVKTTTFALDLGLIAGVMFLFGALYWTIPYGSGIVVGQENWSSIFTIVGLVFLGASGVLWFRCQTWKSLIATFRSIIPLVPVGILITFATGWVGGSEGVNPGGTMASNYGLPFPWKIVQSSCPPPCVQVNGTVYNPLFFALDSLFFIAAVYFLIRGYQRATKNGSRESST
jgi:hypothetical protein